MGSVSKTRGPETQNSLQQCLVNKLMALKNQLISIKYDRNGYIMFFHGLISTIIEDITLDTISQILSLGPAAAICPY